MIVTFSTRCTISAGKQRIPQSNLEHSTGVVSIEKLVRGAEQPGGGMKTWRESLIPDDNAIRINRRSERRPWLVGFDLSKGLFERRLFDKSNNEKRGIEDRGYGIIRFEKIF